MFFSFDGVDGAGKSTQLRLLCEWLRDQGRDVVTCRDPGSTPLGEELRRLVLERHDLSIHRRSEMLLYMAARTQLVEEVIRPALAAGRTVVSDRFLLANVVYQAHAGGLDAEDVWQVGRVAVDDVTPDLVFVLDLSIEDAAMRIRRPLDRMELQGPEFLGRVREGFLVEARRNPERIIVIDATRPIDVIQSEIRAAASRELQRETSGGKVATNSISEANRPC